MIRRMLRSLVSPTSPTWKVRDGNFNWTGGSGRRATGSGNERSLVAPLACGRERGELRERERRGALRWSGDVTAATARENDRGNQRREQPAQPAQGSRLRRFGFVCSSSRLIGMHLSRPFRNAL